MTKIRVHELAKELGMENKVLMDVLKKKEVFAKKYFFLTVFVDRGKKIE